MTTSVASVPSWVRQRLTMFVLVVVLAGLGLGGVFHATGANAAGDATWVVVAGIGAVLSLYSMIESVRHGRLGVDVIALAALVGAVAVREYLAAGIISAMVATGQSLDDWATGRARRELAALLTRAPKSAH